MFSSLNCNIKYIKWLSSYLLKIIIQWIVQNNLLKIFVTLVPSMLNNITSRSLKFLPNKNFFVFCGFFLRLKLPGTRLCNFTKNELLQRYFSRILTENFPKQLSEKLFIRTSFFPEQLCGCFRTLFSSTRLLFIVFLISRLLFCHVYPRHQVQFP